ncbi:TetR/AcrR family transcriptional regulator [Streptomyces sp. NPDC002514]|uniref:TetR/AcrR family transcriptional regulator n=1 Tax=Streptomyces sp. NPDC001270 TaxID=3364554 RepID=UPI0036A9EF2B
MRTNARDRIISTAARLFRERGVTGTGVLTVLAEAQAPRGSLYHHFPGGKDQLVVAALRYESDRVTGQLRALLAEDVDESTALTLFAEALATDLEQSGFRLGCPVSTATLELASDNDEIRTVCSATYQAWTRLVADHLLRRGFDASAADAHAELVVAAFEGALLLARAARNADALRRVAKSLSGYAAELRR